MTTTIADARSALAILKLVQGPLAGNALVSRFEPAIKCIENICSQSTSAQHRAPQFMAKSAYGATVANAKFRKAIVQALPSVTENDYFKLLPAGVENNIHTIVRLTRWLHKHLIVSSVLNAAFALVGLFARYNERHSDETDKDRRIDALQVCMHQLRADWDRLSEFFLTGRWVTSSVEAAVSGWWHIFVDSRSRTMFLLHPFHDHFSTLIGGEFTWANWCSANHVPSNGHSPWFRILRYLGQTLELTGSLGAPPHLPAIQHWYEQHSGSPQWMQLALEFDEAGAQSFSTLEIAYQLVKLIGDTEELKTLQRRHLIGGIQAQATLIKTVENSIHAAREHLDRIRASVHNVGDSVRTALVFRDQTVVHTLWSKHASELISPLMTRFTTLAGPDFMDHVHQINQKSASIRAGFEQLVTFLAMYQIPIHHNNVSEWYEERARFVQHQLQAASNGTAFSLARSVTAREIHTRSSRMATLSRYLRNHHGRDTAFGY